MTIESALTWATTATREGETRTFIAVVVECATEKAEREGAL